MGYMSARMVGRVVDVKSVRALVLTVEDMALAMVGYVVVRAAGLETIARRLVIVVGLCLAAAVAHFVLGRHHAAQHGAEIAAINLVQPMEETLQTAPQIHRITTAMVVAAPDLVANAVPATGLAIVTTHADHNPRPQWEGWWLGAIILTKKLRPAVGTTQHVMVVNIIQYNVMVVNIIQ